MNMPAIPSVCSRLYTKPAFIILLFSCFTFSCLPAQTGYNLRRPDTVFVLPDTLREVSGITMLDSSMLACVQDENGIVFIYDTRSARIIRQFSFSGNGDYEGIARVQNALYVLMSNGILYHITDYRSDGKIIPLPTGIPCDNNEGLCYDETGNRLLIACKSPPGKEGAYKGERCIYSFDPGTKKLSEKPVYKTDIGSIRKFVSLRRTDVHDLKFRPSAIAIHPFTKKIWLLSASDHLLFIFSREGAPQHVELLDTALFSQAEGITFSANGDLFISNEAHGKKATLLRFRYHSY